jgi:hypothetical protein
MARVNHKRWSSAAAFVPPVSLPGAAFKTAGMILTATKNAAAQAVTQEPRI